MDAFYVKAKIFDDGWARDVEQSYISGLFLVVYRPNNDLFRFFAAKSKNISLNQLHQNRGGVQKEKPRP